MITTYNKINCNHVFFSSIADLWSVKCCPVRLISTVIFTLVLKTHRLKTYRFSTQPGLREVISCDCKVDSPCWSLQPMLGKPWTHDANKHLFSRQSDRSPGRASRLRRLLPGSAVWGFMKAKHKQRTTTRRPYSSQSLVQRWARGCVSMFREPDQYSAVQKLQSRFVREGVWEREKQTGRKY